MMLFLYFYSTSYKYNIIFYKYYDKTSKLAQSNWNEVNSDISLKIFL